MFALEHFCFWQERLRYLSKFLKLMKRKITAMTMSFTPVMKAVMKAVMMIISVLKQVKVESNVFRTGSVDFIIFIRQVLHDIIYYFTLLFWKLEEANL